MIILLTRMAISSRGPMPETVLCLIIFSLLLACRSVGVQTLHKMPQAADSKAEVDIQIHDDETTLWECSVVDKLSKGSIKYIRSFPDRSGVIVTSQGDLFSILDSKVGKRLSSVEIPEGGYISTVDFVTPEIGSIAINQIPEIADENKIEKRAQIYSTINGGQTWSRHFDQRAAEITKLAYGTSKDWWATGRRDRGSEASRPSILLISKANNEGELKDFSQESVLEKVTEGRDLVKKNGTLLLLSDEGYIFGISIERKEISPLERIQARPELYLRQIGQRSNAIWVIGSTDSRERLESSYFSLEDSRVTIFNLSNTYLREGVQMSESEIVFPGYFSRNEVVEIEKRNRVGMIVYKNNDSWSRVCAETEFSPYASIDLLDNNRIMIGSESSIILAQRRISN